jgi:hypothetical protein
VRVGVIFPGVVVPVFADRFVRGQFFEPIVIVLVQTALVVVDEYAGSDVHRRTKDQHIIPHIPLSPLFQPMPL